MEFGLLSVVAVIILVGASILGSKIRVAAPLLLVVLGIGIGYLPFVPLVEIDPEIILLVVLPPLLYAAAVNVPIVDFRRNFRPVIGLSVILVIISAVLVGLAVHWLVPAIPLPAAIALGAVISPTDAVAATSIGKRLGMPERVVSILEGESLVNDATSLVLLKTAIAAVSGSFALATATRSFLFSVVAALVIGFLIGYVTVWIRSKLTNPVHDTIISFIVPFVAFIPAEEVNASGVLAVVVTGLYTGHHSSQRFSASARMNERLNWRTIQFLLENGVFLIMGLQLHSLVEQVGESQLRIEHVGYLALALVLILIVCRAVFLVPLISGMRFVTKRYERRNAGYERLNKRVEASGLHDREDSRIRARLRQLDIRAQRSAADLEHEREQQLSWRDGVVLSWSGMRGVVTLAAAQSIPTTVPYRPQLVLAAFAVAVVTLLLNGLSLPLLIRKLWPNGAGSGREKAELISLSKDLWDAADEAINDEIAESPELRDPENDPDPDHAEAVVISIKRARASARNALMPLAAAAAAPTTPIDVPGEETPRQLYQRLSRLALDAQREALLEERAIGRYSSQALRAAELSLDAYETRLMPPSQ